MGKNEEISLWQPASWSGKLHYQLAWARSLEGTLELWFLTRRKFLNIYLPRLWDCGLGTCIWKSTTGNGCTPLTKCSFFQEHVENWGRIFKGISVWREEAGPLEGTPSGPTSAVTQCCYLIPCSSGTFSHRALFLCLWTPDTFSLLLKLSFLELLEFRLKERKFRFHSREAQILFQRWTTWINYELCKVVFDFDFCFLGILIQPGTGKLKFTAF